MKAALKLALDALEESIDDVQNCRSNLLHGAGYDRYDRQIKFFDEQIIRHQAAIAAAKQALAQPDQPGDKETCQNYGKPVEVKERNT